MRLPQAPGLRLFYARDVLMVDKAVRSRSSGLLRSTT